ncbi:M1 family metallopeptidase [Paenibacillus woosongensis]|uniref:M1 family peptidase n=1 Tax=Paenibacillus woosongensis TaxID=307580 RepID=A0A7X3CMQ8_9BACL|nr:M1 family metallopeptidase [Paenibacillus woosongensis]MUG45898.1 M1 family peptidase [Paenibacillus woosongensis]
MYRITFKSVSQKTLAYSLAFTLAASPVVGAGQALAQPAAVATAETIAMAQAHAQVQYRINAKLDEKNMRIQGSETVTYRNTSNDTLREIVFHTFADANRSKATQTSMFERNNEEIRKENPQKKPEDFLGGIDIWSAAVDGQPLVFSNNNQALTVKLQQELKPGEAVTVEIGFEVKIPYGMQRLSYYKDIINGAHWFPVMSVYDENKHEWDNKPYSKTFETDYYNSSDFEVHFNVPEAYQVLMPGTITMQADPKEPGRKVVTADADNTREHVFFASPNYKVERVTRDGLTVEYYYFDNMPDKKKLVDEYIDTAFKAIQFFSEKYGEYPYPEFRIAESYVEGVAVEFARVIQMGQIRPNSDPAHDYVFVHEIAHQWFHALIGNNSEAESFLDEGFADFSMVYFAEKQGDDLNGFKTIQIDDLSYLDKPIASNNTEVGGETSPVFYKKGRQAIYQLYRMVGEEKFDAFMQEYFNRYAYKNATISGLLHTIQDTLGEEARKEMDKALHDPQFALKPEYRLSEAEEASYWHEQFKISYHSSLIQVANLPAETMSRIVDKALQGEPLTIVVSDQAGGKAKKQQQTILTQLEGTLTIMGIPYEVVSDRQKLKQQLEKKLATSNIIAIGSAKTNGLIQALKPGIIQKSKAIGFDWKSMMNQKASSGAYVIKHPYNQNRLLLHFFWNGDALSDNAVEPFAEQMLQSLGFSGNFYQYYVLNKTGHVATDKKIGNPLAKFFGEE